MHPQPTSAPLPLFDRFDGPLIDSGVLLPSAEALQLSLRLDLTRLFNVRNRMTVDEFLSGAPTSLDYGLPDTLHLSAQSATDLQRWQQVILRAIALYEPRLRQVAVTVAPNAGRPTLAWVAISATAILGSERIQFHFEAGLTNRAAPVDAVCLT
jgi:type VI secretion system protein ImpF